MTKSRFRFLNSAVALVIMGFMIILPIVGIMLFHRMDTLLINYAGNQVQKRAETLSELASQKLHSELEHLGHFASLIEEKPEDAEIVMQMLAQEKGTNQEGLITIDGNAICGKALSIMDHPGIQISFRGKAAITFVEGKGLLFSCPVFHGTNIRYVIYRLCPVDTLEERFSISCYENLGKVLVAARDGQIIVPFDRSDKEDVAFYQSEEIQKDYLSMHREMELSVAVAKRFRTERGEMFLFEAEVPGTNFLAVGFVPREVAVEGINRISYLVTFVFGLLMLLVLIGGIYLTSAAVKIKESKELREAKAAAEEASRAKSNFLANMSHEIRTPINAVLGMDEMILRETGEAKTRQHAINIQRAGNTLLSLINDVLDFSKIEAGKMELVPADYDFAVMLADLTDMIRPRIEGKGLQFFLEIDEQIPRYLYGDPVRLKQCILNILTNAVKYTKQGGVHLSVSAKGKTEEMVELSVRVEDTGVGIKKEDIERLFTAFERIDEKQNRNIEGTGLGMNIVKHLLTMMDSSLEVQSEYGRGSVFSFSVRQKITGEGVIGDFKSAAQIVAEKESKHHRSFTAPGALVLIVDDSEMNLEVARGLLEETEISVDTVLSGAEALELMDSRTYDVLLFDHMMPEMDGIELLHMLRKWTDNPNHEKPCIILTANAVSGAKEKYLEEGFDNYLSKPVKGRALEEMLMKYLPADKVFLESEISEAEDAENFPAAGSEEEPLSEKAWYDGLEGIDGAAGLGNCGSEKTYKQVAGVFYKTLEDCADELDAFFKKEDWSSYRIKVHALKSSANTIGARKLGEDAKRMEQAAKEEDAFYIREHHDSLLTDYRKYREVLKKFFGESKEDPVQRVEKVASDEYILGVYKAVEEASRMVDYASLEEIFSEMDGYALSEKDRAVFEKLWERFEQFDYEGMLAILKEVGGNGNRLKTEDEKRD